MVDITNFSKSEAAGLMSMVRITEDSLAFATKSFDPATGEESDPVVVGGSIKQFRERVVELQAEIKRLNAFIAKAEALVAQN